ncbi:MAG: hypothetical protein HYV28_00375 [Ignavibacteriales bacterium]|nr:hypothetical protein [Ignavibacteriales bacterium]
MKSRSLSLLVVTTILLPFILFNCKSPTESSVTNTGTGNTVSYSITITGYVIDQSSLEVLSDASVIVKTTAGNFGGTTSATGKYTLQFNLDASQLVTVITSKTNYKPDTTTILAERNVTNTVKPIALKKLAGTGVITGSGSPSSVYLAAQTAPSIGIRGAGSNEVVKLTFQIVDSANIPISISNAAVVKFKFGARPNGGEFLYPDFTLSDSSGQASVFVTAGTKAGVVQAIIEVTSSGKTITTMPVNIAIHGGLPDEGHFGVATQYLNFAGYNIFGLKNSISAYLGDKYGNPVKPGTTVYFTTTGGIIAGSAQSSEDGIASVSLLSAEPRPTHHTRGAGFAIITASTASENSVSFSKTIDVLFSGVSLLTIKPNSVDIPNGGSQLFEYEVKDQNDNPLAPGTTVSVSVEGENVKVSGATSFQMPDTQSKSYTKFRFVVYDTADTVDVVKPVNIKVTSSGSNGASELNISGTAR